MKTGWKNELILIKSVKCTQICLCWGQAGDSCCACLFFWDTELGTALFPAFSSPATAPSPHPFLHCSRVWFGLLLLPLVVH